MYSSNIVEKRKHPRVNVKMPVDIRESKSDRSFIGTIRDISAGGLRIRSKNMLEINRQLSVSFIIQGRIIKNVFVSAVRCEKNDDGTFSSGLSLNNNVTGENSLFEKSIEKLIIERKHCPD